MLEWSAPRPRVKSSTTARHKSTKTKRKWDTGGKGCACEKTTEAEEAPRSIQLPLHVEDVPPHPTPLDAGARQPQTFAGPGPIPRCRTWFPNGGNAEDHVDEAAGIAVRPGSWESRGHRRGCRVELIAVSLGFYLATKPRNVSNPHLHAAAANEPTIWGKNWNGVGTTIRSDGLETMGNSFLGENVCELCAVGWFTTTQQMQHLALAIEWLFHSLVYIYTNIEYIYIEPMLTVGAKCTFHTPREPANDAFLQNDRCSDPTTARVPPPPIFRTPRVPAGDTCLQDNRCPNPAAASFSPREPADDVCSDPAAVRVPPPLVFHTQRTYR
jgi:hypothetical protein